MVLACDRKQTLKSDTAGVKMAPLGSTWPPKGQGPPKCLPRRFELHQKMKSWPQGFSKSTEATAQLQFSRICCDLSCFPPRFWDTSLLNLSDNGSRPSGEIRDSGPPVESCYRECTYTMSAAVWAKPIWIQHDALLT